MQKAAKPCPIWAELGVNGLYKIAQLCKKLQFCAEMDDQINIKINC